jgi:signal transduction histidine kinase
MEDYATRVRGEMSKKGRAPPTRFAAEMLSVVNDIMKVGSVDRVLEDIAGSMAQLFAIKAMVIGVLDESENVFRVRATYGYDAERTKKIRKFVYTQERLEMDTADRYKIAPDVFLIRPEPGVPLKGEEPFYANLQASKQPRTDPMVWHELDYIRFIFRNREGSALGFLEINEASDNRIPDGSTIEEMQIFSELAAVAIENATLYQRQVDIAERTRFLGAVIAHDINNLNQAVTSYLQLAMDGKSLSEKTRKYLERASSSAWGISELIQRSNKLMKIEREGAQNLGPLELGEVLKECVAEVARIYTDREVKFDLKLGNHRYFVTGNELANEVFTNIIDNAVKYDPHEMIHVEISVGEFMIEPRKYWCVSVADHGIGIPDSKKTVVFGKLTSGEERQVGSGLGLSIVRAIVEAYRGLVWVEDMVPGDQSKGCVFRVALPMASVK